MSLSEKEKKGKHAIAAIKIDMSKAYDKLEWKFPNDMMLKLGFQAR